MQRDLVDGVLAKQSGGDLGSPLSSAVLLRETKAQSFPICIMGIMILTS